MILYVTFIFSFKGYSHDNKHSLFSEGEGFAYNYNLISFKFFVWFCTAIVVYGHLY